MPTSLEARPEISSASQWQDRALCTGKTELFFAPPGERRIRRERREATARSYCAVCPVAETCRQAGRDNNENGIWGGENDEERALAGYAPSSIFRRDVAAARRIGLHRIAAQNQIDADIEVA
jgi:WhiB family redox-sensing transcriptional regulator